VCQLNGAANKDGIDFSNEVTIKTKYTESGDIG
jgi:hypothetical protein